MVAEPRTHVDVEGAVRAWAREALTSLDGHVFFGVNDALAKAKATQVVLAKVAGDDMAALIQFDCWGATKAVAFAAAAELSSAAEQLGRYAGFDGVLLIGANVESDGRWLPDPESDLPRYVVDITFTAVSAVSL